jgi:hypothetical protein
MTDKVIPFRVVQSDSENRESEEHTTVQMLNRALETEWENVCIVGIKKDTKELHVFPDKNLYLGDLHLLLAKAQALIVSGQFEYLD